jgi:hypothetical protein
VWLLARMLYTLLRLPALLRRPIRDTVRRMAHPAHAPPRFEPHQVAVYVRFLVKTIWFARQQPCLYRALLLYRFLPEAGVSPRIFFGARRDSDQPEPAPTEPGLDGHAWVEAEGEVILDTPEHVRGYTVAYSAPET